MPAHLSECHTLYRNRHSAARATREKGDDECCSGNSTNDNITLSKTLAVVRRATDAQHMDFGAVERDAQRRSRLRLLRYCGLGAPRLCVASILPATGEI